MGTVYGVSGYQQGTASSLNANKIPKKQRIIKLITSQAGGAALRPTSGQLYPRTA